ncbi:MAG: hypothetical protein U9P68_07470 [Pseudomonadota bacterium]|nr:hypothetical protein [Pseudomonadota bacterium]
MEPTFPISVGTKQYYVNLDDAGHVDSVSVAFTDVDPAKGMVWNQGDGSALPSLSVGGGFILEAEHDIRSWQSVIAPYALIDIDYNDYEINTSKEDGDIELENSVNSINFRKEEREVWGQDEYGVFGRAFLLIQHSYEKIEYMNFFIEGRKCLGFEKYIDAYNLFYLFLESKFGLPHRNNGAVEKLLKNAEFETALRNAISDFGSNLPESSKFYTAFALPIDLRKAIKAIVQLRGYLRHHSLGNPARWDPLNQKRFETETRLLAIVVQDLANPETFSRVWEVEPQEEFLRQAQEWGYMTQVNVHLTFRQDGIVRDVGLNLNFPTNQPNAALAQTALQEALKVFNERSPGAELLGMRATVAPKSKELFRFDLGPGLLR